MIIEKKKDSFYNFNQNFRYKLRTLCINLEKPYRYYDIYFSKPVFQDNKQNKEKINTG